MGSDLADGDYSAICALGVRGDGHFYVEADIEITGPEDTITRLIAFMDRLPRLPDVVGIESVGFAKLVKDIGAARLAEAGILVPVIALKPTMKHVSTGKDVTVRKQDRISMVLDTFIREQLVRYIRSRGTTRLVHQLENFPMKKYHDDGPDAMEMCFRLLREVGQHKAELARIHSR
jgi:predicted phage terminase large subunit-like protein